MTSSTPGPESSPDTLTLREGLDRYYAQFPGLTHPNPDDPSSELFLPHDVCHVVFGLGTSLVEETMVDVWTIFGSDIPFRTYLGYTKYVGSIDPGGIVRKLGAWNVLREFAASLPYGFRAWRAAASMRKPWCFNGYEQYLDRRISEIREEFGIAPVQVSAAHHKYSTVA